jgi:hypothetical protein
VALGDAPYSRTAGGEYNASYLTPRVGSYAMDVELAPRGGLTGAYFNNRC